jgi:hypothetical protein
MALGRRGGGARDTGGRGSGGIGATQAALAVVVVGAVALAAVLLRPHGSPQIRGRGPLGGSGPLTFLFAVAALGAGLALHSRLSARIPYARQLTALEQRLSDVARAVLVIAAIGVPALILALHRFGAGTAGGGGAVRHTWHPPAPRPFATHSPPPHHYPRAPAHHYGIMRVLAVVVVVLLLTALAVAGVHLVRRLRLPAPPRNAPADEAAADDERVRLAKAVDRGRRALDGGDDPRTAVIACYAAMEESLAASGVARHASDSPRDLLERAVAGGPPARAAATVLTSLFREARYSTHPMTGAHRDRAATALAELADRLAARGSAGPGTGVPAAPGAGPGGAEGPAAKGAR